MQVMLNCIQTHYFFAVLMSEEICTLMLKIVSSGSQCIKIDVNNRISCIVSCTCTPHLNNLSTPAMNKLGLQHFDTND